MRRLRHSLLFIIIALLIGCESQSALPQIKVSEGNPRIEAQGGEISVSIIHYNVDSWNIKDDGASWVTYSLTEANDSTQLLKITALENDGEDARSASVILTANGKGGEKTSGTIKITQAAPHIGRDLTVPSKKLVNGTITNVKYSVLLPDGYSPDTKYPVLYLLHGMSGNNNSWLDDGNGWKLTCEAIGKGIIEPFIVIMPDGYDAFYCDGFEGYKNGTYHYMTFFFEEFVPYIEEQYGIDKEKRGIAGLSMGGFGTMYLCFLHPEMFDLAYAMSPAISVVPGINLNALAQKGAETSDTLPRVVIAIGTSDFLYNNYTFTNFDKSLGNSGFDHELVLDPGYAHTWDYWQLCYPRVLEELGKLW